jgi:hypothetical protein
MENQPVFDREHKIVNFGKLSIGFDKNPQIDRFFLPLADYDDRKIGDECTVWFVVDAFNANFEKYRIVWTFNVIKGKESENVEDYPWDGKHITKIIQCDRDIFSKMLSWKDDELAQN